MAYARAAIRAVSIRAPAKGATRHGAIGYMIDNPFRSALPRRERPSLDSGDAATAQFRSALPRRERPGRRLRRRRRQEVSIRAPAKGATPRRMLWRRHHMEFRSALPRRERRSSAPSGGLPRMFRSALPRRERLNDSAKTIVDYVFRSALPRRERRDMASADVVRAVDVSIRAPAKGATVQSPSARRSVSSFDPRSREGSDLRGEIAQQCLLVFRSALPRRERLAARNEGKRARVVSIRAPAKGATRGPDDDCRGSPVFRSALPRRERRSAGAGVGRFSTVSIRAPAKGATTDRPQQRLRTDVSIRAPAKGATPGHCRRLISVGRVSIRAPAKGATTTDLRIAPVSIRAPARERLGRRLMPWTVSIRAPAKGATGCAVGRIERWSWVSIRAPAKGATEHRKLCNQAAHCVSIRAPAKGATRSCRPACLAGNGFDPRSREGSDRALLSS